MIQTYKPPSTGSVAFQSLSCRRPLCIPAAVELHAESLEKDLLPQCMLFWNGVPLQNLLLGQSSGNNMKKNTWDGQNLGSFPLDQLSIGPVVQNNEIWTKPGQPRVDLDEKARSED